MGRRHGSFGRVGAGLALTLAVVALGAPAAHAGNPPTVAVVGDSVGRDAEAQIRAQLGRDRAVVSFEAFGGSTVDYHHPRVVDLLEGPGAPDILLIELGTGDAHWDLTKAQFRTHVRAFLDDVSPLVDCAMWFEVKPGGTYAYPGVNTNGAAFNRIIRSAVGHYPNVGSVHYEHWVELTGSTYFLPDGLHHNLGGRQELGRLMRTAANGCDPAAAGGPYWDVADDFWAADAINWLDAEGIATGYDNDSFRALVASQTPDITRAQVTAMVWRHAGQPPASSSHGWSDGAPWIDPALDWVAESGLMNGFGNGTFRPNDPITRGQVARLLWRIAGQPAAPPHGWSDGAPWVNDALNWAAAHNLLTGFGDGTVRPDAFITRGQSARLLYRFDQLPPAAPPAAEPDGDPPTTTEPPTTTVPGPAPSTSAPQPTTPTTRPPNTTIPAPTTSTPAPTTTSPPPPEPPTTTPSTADVLGRGHP